MDFEWVTVRTSTGRNYARYLGVAMVVVTVLAGVPLLSTSGAASTSLTTSNVGVTSNSGMLQSLTVAPNGTISYDGLESPPSSVVVTVSVREQSGSWQQLDRETTSASGLEGSTDYSFPTVDVLGSTSLQRQDFRAPDGDSKTTTLELRVSVALVGAGPGGSNVTTSATDSFDVTVTNEGARAGVNGRGNTNGSGN